MHEQDNRDAEPGAELDLLIRSSLETYAEPESGLAERVLARVGAEQVAGKLIKLSQAPENDPSGAKALTHFAGFIGTTEVMPFYKASSAHSRTSLPAAAEGAHERARRTNRTRRMSRLAIALPVAACLMVAIVLAGLKTLHKPADSTYGAGVTHRAPTNAGAGGTIATSPSNTARRYDISLPPRHSSHTAAAVRVQRLPKLDVFPTPQPLTPAEQALVAYVAHAPEAERQSLVEAQKQLDAPLTIAALEIKPLEPPEPGGN